MPSLKLTIDAIPYSSGFANLARLLPSHEWDKIRKWSYKQAGYRCRICGKDARLNCHEIWSFNNETGYQHLMGFVALCDDCHGVKHLLYNEHQPTFQRLAQHFMRVNGVGYDVFQMHLDAARMEQKERDSREWHISFGSYSFSVPVLKDRGQRKKFVALERPQYRIQRKSILSDESDGFSGFYDE